MRHPPAEAGRYGTAGRMNEASMVIRREAGGGSDPGLGLEKWVGGEVFVAIQEPLWE